MTYPMQFISTLFKLNFILKFADLKPNIVLNLLPVMVRLPTLIFLALPDSVLSITVISFLILTEVDLALL